MRLTHIRLRKRLHMCSWCGLVCSCEL